MYREVTDEEIEAAAAIDWKEFFKDSLMEPFDIKLAGRPPKDVELLEGSSVRRKPRQRRSRISRRTRTLLEAQKTPQEKYHSETPSSRKYCARLSKKQKETCQLNH